MTDYDYRLSDDRGELLFGDGLLSGNTKNLGNVRTRPRVPRRRLLLIVVCNFSRFGRVL
ncbi:MAG TPA: hypothetical protein VKE40_09585 [Gemmataceae bacterium]|nr:hypothetical protein [Gemmataceae bacterium]